MQELFFELLRVSLGTQEGLTQTTTDKEWVELFNLSIKQSLSGVMLGGLERVLESNAVAKPSILFEWIGEEQVIENQNRLQNRRAKELYEIFSEGGFRSCVLKGQGTASYYDRPELRQSGDIDLWVEMLLNATTPYVENEGIEEIEDIEELEDLEEV